MNDQNKGLYNKYQVINRETGEEVEGDYFILKPGKDTAARIALLTYAAHTDNVLLAVDIYLWNQKIGGETAMNKQTSPPEFLEQQERLIKELEEANSKHTEAIRLLMQVTDILSMGRTPDRAGAALKEIYLWLHENKPAGQEGERNQ